MIAKRSFHRLAVHADLLFIFSKSAISRRKKGRGFHRGKHATDCKVTDVPDGKTDNELFARARAGYLFLVTIAFFFFFFFLFSCKPTGLNGTARN